MEEFENNGCAEEPACYQTYMRVNHFGEWDDGFQYTEHPYICEYRGRFLVSGEMKSWEEAKKECHEAGLQLARIRSDQDLEVGLHELYNPEIDLRPQRFKITSVQNRNQ
jgi:hypothetical protein